MRKCFFAGVVFMVIAIVFIIGLIFIQPNRLGLVPSPTASTSFDAQLGAIDSSVMKGLSISNRSFAICLNSIGHNDCFSQPRRSVSKQQSSPSMPSSLLILGWNSLKYHRPCRIVGTTALGASVLTMGTLGIHEAGWYAGLNSLGVHADIAVASGIMTQVATLTLSLVLACALYCWKPRDVATSSYDARRAKIRAQ